MNKRVLSFVLALVMVLTMLPMTAMAANATKFTDVTKDKWYYTFVDFVTEKGYFAGTSETTFSPDVTMTRAMFVTVLANLDGAKVDNTKTAFKDVAAGKWYAGSAKWAVDNKILSGYADGTFRPDAKISREEMCVIMKNYIDYYSEENNVEHKLNGTDKAFPDSAKISSWAKSAVADCREYGLIDGFASDGTFRPKNGSTRAEVAAVIYKLAWLVKESGGNGGGGSSSKDDTIYGPYDLRAKVDLALTLTGTRKATATFKVDDYYMNESVYAVMQKFDDQNEDTILAAFNDVIGTAKQKGLLNENDEVKLVGIPVDAMESGAEVTSQVIENVKTNIKNDAAVVEALEQAGVASGDTSKYIDRVIDALVSGSGIATADAEEAAKQLEVVKALEEEVGDMDQAKVEEILERPEYADYKNMVEEMNIDLGMTITSYQEQLASIRGDLEKVAGSRTRAAAAGESEDVYYLKQKDNKLQTYMVVDPIEVAKQQYEARKDKVYSYVAKSADVEEWLDSINPENLLDGRKVKTADAYFALMKEQQDHMNTLSKSWKPAEGYADRNAVIDAAAAASKGQMTAEYAQALKAFTGNGAKGMDMTMKEFIEKVLGDRTVDLKKSPEANKATIADTSVTKTVTVNDLPADSSNAAVDKALEWIADEYPNASAEGTVEVIWDFISE